MGVFGQTFGGNLVTLGANLNQWYGIKRDRTIDSSDWIRIASSQSAMSLHRTLPVQNSLKGCLLNADRTVNYYLNPADWTKKADGSASNRTGIDGNVMSRKDKDIFWKFEVDGNFDIVKCSTHPIAGFFILNQDRNFGAYKGKLIGDKLSSIAGVLSTTSRSRIQFRADARANGAGFNMFWNGPMTELAWMQIVEFATFDIQRPVDNTLTPEGYRKGGLGNGVTTADGTEWANFNGYNSFIPTGSSDSLGNGSGEIPITIPNFGGAGINRTFTIPRYHGIEGNFGETWELIDGVNNNNLADRRESWIFDDPSLIADNTSVGARLAGNLPLSEGWMKTILFGAKGDIMPASVGGSSTTGLCDYFYAPALGSGWMGLLFGGVAYNWSYAGRFMSAGFGAADASTAVGARLSAR